MSYKSWTKSLLPGGAGVERAEDRGGGGSPWRSPCAQNSPNRVGCLPVLGSGYQPLTGDRHEGTPPSPPLT
ncbi:hypothetical protein [Laspinema olomoucense]|uniref:hypothetical protein n=1 Tax=Laspinema olomoucense TaxID=3231600 RepID=UPI0021BB01C9|nr:MULTISPECIES: hypothetical protein [unclassified Laspinema]MCT7989769.1 hypothetical protein [Laspinema sp. D3a]MCT7994169.1 hypothetical protein [Laspinema sp. D3c]